MASSPVQPLRIHKGTPANSPLKSGSSIPRPLSDLAPTEKRRNSPSFNQTPKKMMLKQDSSPFQSSPFNASDTNSSPRLFWQGRDPSTPNRYNAENSGYDNRESSPSPTRRSSIERLQRASRVKNSNMFAREKKEEYDPTNIPIIERPLAKQVQGNAYGGAGLEGLRAQQASSPWRHKRTESKTTLPVISPVRESAVPSTPSSLNKRPASRDQASPTKSSLAQRLFPTKSLYDPESDTWAGESDNDQDIQEGSYQHRHPKSVTFDQNPQINEYEMATPDLSSIGTGSRENSYDHTEEEEEEDLYSRDESEDHDDSFDASLEDTEKTPVVGPDDWKTSSPDTQHSVSGRLEDPFVGPEGSPMPDALPSTPTTPRSALSRIDSNGNPRPLPPLPAIVSPPPKGLFAAAERASSCERAPSSPPKAASSSKFDIMSMASSKMTLEERLHLMMIQEDKPKSAAEEQRERRMRRAPKEKSATPDRDDQIKIHADEIELDEDTLGELGEFQLASRPTRESILRKVNGLESTGQDSMGGQYDFSSPPPSNPARCKDLDPDVPIPSTEQSILEDEVHDKEDAADQVAIKVEEDEEVSDIYEIAEMYQNSDISQETESEHNQLGSMIQHDLRDAESDDAESNYSEPTPVNQSPNPDHANSADEDSPPTPKLMSPIQIIPSRNTSAASKQDVSLPDFTGFMSSNDFGLSLQDYMTPSPPPLDIYEAKADTRHLESPLSLPAVEAKEPKIAIQSLQQPERPLTPLAQTKLLPMPDYDGAGWGDDTDEIDVSTPDSVIRHPIVEDFKEETPEVPQKIATIKGASGSRLKTRPSNTPADLMAMREARRQISGEMQDIPPIPARHRNRPSLSLDRSQSDLGPVAAIDEADTDTVSQRIPSFKRSLTLDIGTDMGLGLDKDFDRVIEQQKVAYSLFPSHPDFPHLVPGQASWTETKVIYNNGPSADTSARQRGYLMRQNTKVVVASSDVGKAPDQAQAATRSVGNSPVKQQDRPQSWVVEPWNGSRRKSVRSETAARKKATGAAPPLPGQESAVSGLSSMAEEETVQEPTIIESGERGRLFVKVIAVKDLDLPLPKSERSWFSLTLDNGVHCVTTAWLELGKTAPIGQEFELVVPSELEFQLTLNAKLDRPAPKRVVESPTKIPKSPTKTSAFSRVFASPKKRKELDLRQKEEENRAAREQQEEAFARRAPPTTWDLLSPLAAEDGSFGRSYVCLKDHESRCYGRPYLVDVPCFNEWATEEATAASSVKSKRGYTHVQRRAPYKVGKLELQLLFVPRPKGAKDDDMPKSMNSCIRQMKEAETAQARAFEGHLSQQGGDCPYWRRRFFKLAGAKLTAYHESTMQPRATINLANASKLIDDRSTLTQKEVSGKGGSRRKSGFGEEEEGYMFVEEGFRIRFANGEVIDFYADSASDKEGWMKVLDQAIGKGSVDGTSAGAGKWCDIVIKREESLLRKQSRKASVRPAGGAHSRTKSSIV